MLRKGLFITAADRPAYFRDVMNTWRNVRGFYDWHVVISMEPTDLLDQHYNVIAELEHPNIRTVINPHVFGVLHHPYVGFENMFRTFDFVIRGEDDLIVSDDILEYFSWAAEEYKDDKEIAAVIGFNAGEGEPDDVVRLGRFQPWVWGTWHDRWKEYIGPTWDHDYSTYNGYPNNEAGWDWNLNTRVLPELHKMCIFPSKSRVDNIGYWGVHGTPENIQQAKQFDFHNEPVEFRER